MKTEYKHAEAFCLMQYRDETTGGVEVIWNSRDGVTPLCVRSRAGNDAYHVNWEQDQCVPDHKPAPGDRIFVDLTRKAKRAICLARIDRWWSDGDCPMRDSFENKLHALKCLMHTFRPGQPDLITVK